MRSHTSPILKNSFSGILDAASMYYSSSFRLPGSGERQIERHSLGLAQNLGGSGATAVVTILGAV